MVNLRVDVGKLSLKNPVVIASGMPSAKVLKSAMDSGAAAVTTKTITPRPRAGHPTPTVVRVTCGYINAVGLKNPGIEGFKRELEELVDYAVRREALVIGSVAGDTVDDYVRLSAAMEEGGAHAVELNVSCPTVEEVFRTGIDVKYLVSVVRSVRSILKVPLIVKISPVVLDVVYVVSKIWDAGADAVSAVNTVAPATAIDIETGRVILGNPEGFGGLSGPALKPIAVAKVLQIARSLDIPIIGTGGVMNWRDAVEMIMAGADAVGLLTAIFYYKETQFIRDLLDGIRGYMARKGYSKVGEFKGLAVRSLGRA